MKKQFTNPTPIKPEEKKPNQSIKELLEELSIYSEKDGRYYQHVTNIDLIKAVLPILEKIYYDEKTSVPIFVSDFLDYLEELIK